MSNYIFINKNFDKRSSPEYLNEYIKVANPAVWMILAAVIILIIGSLVWAVFCNVDTKLQVVGTCQDNLLTCYVSVDEVEEISADSQIKVDDKSYPVSDIDSTPIKAADNLNDYQLYVNGYDKDDFLCRVYAKTNLQDGDYKTEITVDSVSPISFLLN